jgi:hypothetical protein
MVTRLNDRMVNPPNGRGDVEAPRANGPNPPPPPTLAQSIASILESRDEQTELLWQFVANSAPAHGGNGGRNAPTQAPTTYGDFATTHLLLFTEVTPRMKKNMRSIFRSSYNGFMWTNSILNSASVHFAERGSIYWTCQLRQRHCRWPKKGPRGTWMEVFEIGNINPWLQISSILSSIHSKFV